ncbi:AGE family epimerase/isomerase [Lutimonas sp.]|uniref:AGE family epimerase/isomerase n=1 Tax=Lutimonas sp. TaxID=1872403 RepID=UPI003D9B1259
MNKTSRIAIEKEFKDYLNFWMEQMLSKDQKEIYPEMSQEFIPNKLADMGAMYLGRILYGASRASRTLKQDSYKGLADAAYALLVDFKNPAGGYYWSRKYNMEWSHDADNVNMAQAFVLYGFAEYMNLHASTEVLKRIEGQLNFIQANIGDESEGSYLDGFDQNWARSNAMSRSFGTHFHILEAMVLIYQQDKSSELKESIHDLIKMIIDRFIDKDSYECLHRFSEEWNLMPNENWAGHNAEFSWVICEAAKAINDQKLIALTQELAVKMMDQVIENAADKANGGFFNAIEGNIPLEKSKSWWPQAEVVLGLLNVYKISANEHYHNLAMEQIAYISNHFMSEKGEWYAGLENNGTPQKDMPLVFFWKSMYHTVRYYDYLLHFMK